MADESSPNTPSPEADGSVDAASAGGEGADAGDGDSSGRYDVPPPDDIRRRNRITGFILLLVILTFITVAVWARV